MAGVYCKIEGLYKCMVQRKYQVGDVFNIVVTKQKWYLNTVFTQVVEHHH